MTVTLPVVRARSATEVVTEVIKIDAVSDGEPVSGGAALADGRIALIVDCDALAVVAQTASAGPSIQALLKSPDRSGVAASLAA